MDNVFISTIVNLSKEDLQKYILRCISENEIKQRMDLFLILQNKDYEKYKSSPINNNLRS